MTQVRIETREQPGGRTGQNVTVMAHLGCLGHHFTMPYEKGDEDPHLAAVELMVQRLRSSRHRVFGKDEDVVIEKLSTEFSTGHYVAKGAGR